MGNVLRTERCPRCKDRGADKRADNLAVYDDGHSYCFACGYYGHPSNSLSNLKRRLTPPPTAESYLDGNVYSNLSSDLPPACTLWLSKYGISPVESALHGFRFDERQNLLVMPVLDGDRIVTVNCRNFGIRGPKYLTKGRKDVFKVVQPTPRIGETPCNHYILVEDYLSAIKVGRIANCIPLLGAVAPRKLILSLISKASLLRFWLDRDKAPEAAQQAARARQWIPNCATIITDLDPKEYSDDQIKSILNESLLHPTQSIS